MSEEKKLPERVWCNLYTNNDDSTKGRYHYYTFETEEASHQWRRLANYVCTATFVPESSLAAAREEGRMQGVAQMEKEMLEGSLKILPETFAFDGLRNDLKERIRAAASRAGGGK